MTSPSTQSVAPIADMIHIETIRSAEDWAALANQWNALLDQSHNNVPFLTYEFQRAWWQHLGGGEWQQAELNILVGRDQQGQLLGIAPLFRTQAKDGKQVLQFIGSHEIADFLDFIARPKDLEAFTQSVLHHLEQDNNWERLEFFNLLDSSATLKTLEDAANTAEIKFGKEVLQASPYIEIPTSFDAYIDSLDSKQAHEIRRKLRRAARNPEPLTLEIIQEPSALDQALHDFLNLMGQEADKAAFLRPAMRAQLDTIARTAFANGWLQLFFLKSGDERIAGYMNFDYKNRIWGYNAGFNNDYASLSPGWIIMAEMIKWCVENGRKVFDFMRGDEEYKYRFGGVNRFVQKAVISR